MKGWSLALAALVVVGAVPLQNYRGSNLLELHAKSSASKYNDYDPIITTPDLLNDLESSVDEDGRRRDGRIRAVVQDELLQSSHGYEEGEEKEEEEEEHRNSEEEEEEERERRHRHNHRRHHHHHNGHHHHKRHKHYLEDDDDIEEERLRNNKRKEDEAEQFPQEEAGDGFQYVLDGENQQDREEPEDEAPKFKSKARSQTKAVMGVNSQKDFDSMLLQRGNYQIKNNIKQKKKKRGLAGLETADTVVGTPMKEAESLGAIPFEDDE
mmetsp:Transcript_42407/g.83233  ORF Transcript_42407/g.83233 Transcript_42407/m.83233 type:complete len:267 (-) Transcript_42407:166-966(-)